MDKRQKSRLVLNLQLEAAGQLPVSIKVDQRVEDDAFHDIVGASSSRSRQVKLQLDLKELEGGWQLQNIKVQPSHQPADVQEKLYCLPGLIQVSDKAAAPGPRAIKVDSPRNNSNHGVHSVLPAVDGVPRREGYASKFQERRRLSNQSALEMKEVLERNEAYRQSSCVIWPTSRKAQAWDCAVALVLIYTVMMTPFQVAFLLTLPVAIFILNRVVDSVLLVDMVVQLFMVYRTSSSSSRSSGVWVSNAWKIRLNYLKKWFILDVLGLASSLLEIMDYTVGELGVAQRAKRLAQAIRFFRLFRLARVMERGKNATIHMAGRLPVQVGFFGGEFVSWTCSLLLVAHIAACTFGFIVTVEESDEGGTNWLKVYEVLKNLQIDRDNPMQMYLICLYWAFTVLLTIGFGDATPQTILEHVVCIFVMVTGGVTWALLMASACSLASAMDAERLNHGMKMETLIRMCCDHRLPKDLISRLIHFLVKSRRMEILAGQQELMSKMSPSLQSEVAVHITEKFLRRVDYFQHSEDGFTEVLASSLLLHVFPQKEWLVPPELAAHVVVASQRAKDSDEASAGGTIGFLDKRHCPHLTMLEGGIAILGHLRCVGSCWHKDIILRVESLRDQKVAQSLVFCSVYMLSKEDLLSTIEDARFPKAKRHVRHAAIRLALIRTITRAAPYAKDFHWRLAKACRHILRGGADDAFQRQHLQELQPDDSEDDLPNKVSPVSPLREIRREIRDQSREIRDLKDQLDVRIKDILSVLTAQGAGNGSSRIEGLT